jgi:O-antigen ligase
MTFSLLPDFIYVVLAIFVLQFFNWLQIEYGRTNQFMFITFIYAIYAVATGKAFPVDGVTIALGILTGWFFLSLIWTDSRRSVYEALTWISYFILFMACRTLPVIYTVAAVFSAGVIFAVFQLGYIFAGKKRDGLTEMYVFGNGNHNGIYLLLCLHAGLWLTLNVSVLIFPVLCIIAVALVLTYCRAALVAAFMSLMAVAVWIHGWYAVIGIGLCLVPIAIKIIKGFDPMTAPERKASSIYERLLFYAEALYLIRHKILFGWGLDMYRKLLPFIIPAMRANKRTAPLFDKIGGVSRNLTHRAHNDHLEIMVELGIVGYAMFVWFFGQFDVSLLFVGTLLAMTVNGLFFFPFRETHIAAPFWALMGACSVSSTMPVTIPLVVKIALICAFLAVLRECQRKYLGLYYYDKMSRAKEDEEKQKYITLALRYDPRNNGYLNDAVAIYPEGSPLQHDAAARMMHHYDGDYVMWTVWEGYARSIVAINHLGAARMALAKAIEINPEYLPCVELKGQIDAFLANGEENKQGGNTCQCTK